MTTPQPEAELPEPRPFADRLVDAVAAGIAGRFEPSTAELARRIAEAGR